MKLKAMSEETINLFRQIDAKNQMVWSEGAHLTSAYVSLNVHSAALAESCGLVKNEARRPEIEEGMQVREYMLTLRDFFLIANLQNWNDVVYADVDVETLKKMKKTESLDVLYLSMLNMLMKSYYEKSKVSFKHAWSLFLKFGICDLNVGLDDFETRFNQMTIDDCNEIQKQAL